MSNEILEQDEFTLMLREFNKLIANDPTVDKVKKELNEMKLAASNSNELNIRQKDAIIARCDNYLNGTYGKTKTAENLSYGKEPSK